MLLSLIDKKLHPLVLMGIERQQEAREKNPDVPDSSWQISQEAAQTLLQWNLPAPTAAASLIAPLLELVKESPEGLSEAFGSRAVELAGQLNEWRGSEAASIEQGPEPSHSHYILQRRRLFRQAYLDLPGLDLILLIIADQCARLILLKTKRHAIETEQVYIPLIEMLGMWNLRYTWLDQCASILENEDKDRAKNYQTLAAQIGEPEDYTRTGMSQLLSRKAAQSDSLEGRSWIAKQKKLLEKAEAYLFLEAVLTRRFHEEGMFPLPRVEPRRAILGAALRRAREGESLEELASRLGVRIYCHTVQDCYHVLGIVHSIGKPVAPKFSERFDDYIASPQPNGYQALHTAIIYEGYRKNGGKILVDFRILTPKMHRLNEAGVVTALHRRSTRYRDARAWWNGLEQLSLELNKRYHYEGTTIQGFLKEHDLNTRHNPLYVFTPRGEIILLDDGSTALDFAFHIHTDLGSRARKIEVNGHSVPYNYPLQNGDLIWVHYDPHYPGPDLAWLGFVNTSHAKTKIRKELSARAESIHEGRTILQNVLVKVIQYYRREKHYDLLITTRQLDDYLVQYCNLHRMASLKELYQRIINDRPDPSKLVHDLISRELANALLDGEKQRITHTFQVSLCDICRPVPGEAILAFERHSSTKTRRITVHQEGNPACPGLQVPGRRIYVQWAEKLGSESGSMSKELAQFQIYAEDRPRLLQDILEEVHAEVHPDLYKVDAKSYADGSAEITLIAGVGRLTELAQIQSCLESMPSVLQVLSFPPPPSQALALVPHTPAYRSNPYIEREVFDRLGFYDREGLLQKLLGWLKEDPFSRWLILHGQRRVGKTSLLKYLKHEILPQHRLALPVYVTLQSLSSFSMQSIANLLVQEVFSELQIPAPAQGVNEEPVIWLNHALSQAVKHMNGFRLLLMIDEFNVLLDMQQNGRLDPMVFSNLRAVMSERTDLRWLLVLQDTHFGDPACWGEAGVLFQQATTLPVPQLDPTWAEKLIIEPTERSGLKYAHDGIPGQIFELTAGNPYLIKILCYQLVERLGGQSQSVITEEDLKQVVRLVINDGRRYFDHLAGNLSGLRLILLAMITSLSRDRAWIGVSSVVEAVQSRLKDTHKKLLVRELEALERQGILESVPGSDGGRQIRTHMSLFHLWVQQYIDLEVAVESYAQHRGGKHGKERRP